jgi:hypothetical protein
MPGVLVIDFSRSWNGSERMFFDRVAVKREAAISTAKQDSSSRQPLYFSHKMAEA